MKRRTLFSIIEIGLFILASLGMYFFLQLFMADMRAISRFGESIGRFHLMYLPLFVPTQLLFALHSVIHAENEKTFRRLIFVNGIVLTALMAEVFIVHIIFFITGELKVFYPSITALYPLDFFIISFLYMALGIAMIVFAKRIKFEEIPSNGRKHCKVRRILNSIGYPVYTVFAEYMFGAFLVGFGIADYGSPAFFLSFPTYGAMLLMVAYLVYKEFILEDVNLSPAQDRKLSVLVGGIGLGAALLCSLLGLGFMGLTPNYVIENMLGYFPIDFQGTLNLMPIFLFFPLLTVSISNFVDALRLKKAE